MHLRQKEERELGRLANVGYLNSNTEKKKQSLKNRTSGFTHARAHSMDIRIRRAFGRTNNLSQDVYLINHPD